ncbi:hypothetical protein K9P40_05295 [Lentilactobacillus otakiensis]|uniref:hypothetical protein n=1 Tax=Lentilactobacillus otakiensis TaxID=481720 RepID=UPI001CBBF890|nr:hypothetical protein [Lentilactobacillus otakiensis]MBZ3776491.1 hypothetical protein [Lentilactobacillus otakiensis]
MNRFKEAHQLDLVLKDPKSGISLTDLARQMPATKPTVSRWRHGQRKMDNDTLRRTAKFVKDWFYHYSAAREDYGIISFLQSKRIRTDLFAASVSQEKEESDRKQIQQVAFESAAVPKEQRTQKDWHNIDAYSKEFPEEIGSEITELLSFCKYVGIDPEEVIKSFNQRLGG